MARSTDRSASAVVVFAWIGGFIVNTAYRSAWKSAHDVSSLSEATVIGMGSEALDILAFSLALVLVTRLYQMQHSVATLSARHDDEAASVSASKTKTQWRAAEIFLFGFVGAASLVVILLYATWPTQPRRVNIAAASKPSGSPQNALPHREPTPEEKAVLKWNDQRSAHPLSPINSQASHSVVYLANRHGDFVLNANVNGTPTKFILDTGASSVVLAMADAIAAGIDRNELAFTGRASTVNGITRTAPVRLREIRLGEFSVPDLPASVVENTDVSLLGMSFLRRFQSFEMRDGKVTVTW